MNVGAYPIPVAILAGGLARRLRPLTESIPKSLVPVAGRPFLGHQLELLRAAGIQRVVLCVGHLGQRIQEAFGDGRNSGLRLEYSYDGPVLLGTGGALKHALPLLGERFFVLYGDSYLRVDYRAVAECFDRSGKLGLMTVYRNEGRYDTSNVVFRDGQILVYDKTARRPDMHHIDYGLSVLRAAAFEGYPAGARFDLAELLANLVAQGQLAGYEVAERFYEIGSPAGLAELDALLRSGQVGVSADGPASSGPPPGLSG